MVERFGRFGRIAEAAFPSEAQVRALIITCVECCLPAGAVEGQFETEGLMVTCNPANLASPSEDEELAATLELALARGAQEIIVYGHAGCGMIARLLDARTALEDLPLAAWLASAEGVRLAVCSLPPEDQHPRAVEWNITQQLANLTTCPCVAAAVLTRRVQLRGWLYRP